MAANKNIFSWVPNFITSLNLFSGSLAAIFAIDGHFGLAGIFICLAAIFDFFDGLAARSLKAYTAMGKELDSLADVISFGLAPGALLFTLFEYSLFGTNQPIQDITAKWYQWAILYSALIIPVFSALRLAKFNISENQYVNFIGLPTPANALLWASFGLMLERQDYLEFMKLLFTTKNLLILAIVTSFLLISGIPMFSFKFKNASFSQNWYRYLFLLIALVLFIFFNVYSIPFIFLIYILSNIVFYLLKFKF